MSAIFIIFSNKSNNYRKAQWILMSNYLILNLNGILIPTNFLGRHKNQFLYTTSVYIAVFRHGFLIKNLNFNPLHCFHFFTWIWKNFCDLHLKNQDKILSLKKIKMCKKIWVIFKKSLRPDLCSHRDRKGEVLVVIYLWIWS